MAIEKKKKSDILEFIDKFSTGNCYNAYSFLGCHKADMGFVFRVWAPNAKSVKIVGDFNEWNTSSNPMSHIKNGVWEGFAENARIFDNYKYYIETKDGRFLYKSDPYAFHTCTRPENASKIYNIDEIMKMLEKQNREYLDEILARLDKFEEN